MTRKTTPTFIAEFELLEGSPGAFGVVDRVESLARSLTNAALGRFRDRVRTAKSTPAWAEARRQPKGMVRNQAFDAVREAYGLTKYDVSGVVTSMKNSYPDAANYLGAHVTQKIAARVWQAVERLLFAKAKRIRFKNKNESLSFEGQNNATFLRFFFGHGPLFAPFVTLDGALLLAKFEYKSPYHRHASEHRVKYVRIVKRVIRGQTRYYAQVILEGFAYRDLKKEETHRLKMAEHLLGEGYAGAMHCVEKAYQNRVAVDFGPSRVAISNAVVSFERDIAGEIKDKTKSTRRYHRKMDRQRRAANPQNYNANGTIRKGRKTWLKKIRYQQTQAKHAESCRQAAAQRKSIHGNLTYDVLTLGTEVIVEKVSYKAWQRSRFGKSIAKHGPSALEGTLTRKAENARGSVTRVNTYQTALSSTCLCGARCKKTLSQRFHACTVCGLGTAAPLPRDTFSAYLAIFTESETVSRKKGKAATLSSRLDLEAANSHAPGHRTLSCVLSAAAFSQKPRPASRPAVEVATQVAAQVQSPEALNTDGGHELRVPRGLGAKSGSRADLESAKPRQRKPARQVRNAVTSDASRIPFL